MNEKKVNIIEEKLVFDDFLRVKKGKLQHSMPDGEMSPELNRLYLDRNDAVAAVVYLDDEDSYLFTKQFRYPTYEKGSGWMIELVAGIVEEGEEPEESMKREIMEELGYQITNIEFLTTFFLSPGGTSERIHLYICQCSSAQKMNEGGGAEDENEGIEVIKFSREEVVEKLKSNTFQDAKTIIGMMMAIK
ncbi:MAG TPA: NUDIX hydrolase [Anditalea sp.]|nr:NUDIX hydrolase [Anditalea sp.]